MTENYVLRSYSNNPQINMLSDFLMRDISSVVDISCNSIQRWPLPEKPFPNAVYVNDTIYWPDIYFNNV